jgi:hypothetical protein
MRLSVATVKATVGAALDDGVGQPAVRPDDRALLDDGRPCSMVPGSRVASGATRHVGVDVGGCRVGDATPSA